MGRHKKHKRINLAGLVPLQYVSERVVAAILDRSAKSLQRDRREGRGLPFVRLGPHCVRYLVSDVLTYAESMRCAGTANLATKVSQPADYAESMPATEEPAAAGSMRQPASGEAAAVAGNTPAAPASGPAGARGGRAEAQR
jgi:hypothetical protein